MLSEKELCCGIGSDLFHRPSTGGFSGDSPSSRPTHARANERLRSLPRRHRPCTHIPHLLRIRRIRILTHILLPHPTLQIRRRGRQINRASSLSGAKSQSVSDAAIDDIDTRLVSSTARRVAQEEILRRDDHGGLG